MATLSKKNFSNPDEKINPEKTDMRIVDLAGTKMARIEVQPGWKWSECIKPFLTPMGFNTPLVQFSTNLPVS